MSSTGNYKVTITPTQNKKFRIVILKDNPINLLERRG